MVGAHSTKAVAAAAIAVVSLLMASPAGSTGSSPFQVVTSSGAMSDLSTSTADATDGARGVAISVGRTGRGTTVLLGLWGLSTASAGTVYGAHVHVGPCVGGNGAAAGPHYNTTGGTTIDQTTEVWLDFTATARGTGFAAATVPFVIPSGGARSIVVHAMPTAPNGTAGARLACLPLEY